MSILTEVLNKLKIYAERIKVHPNALAGSLMTEGSLNRLKKKRLKILFNELRNTMVDWSVD